MACMKELGGESTASQDVRRREDQGRDHLGGSCNKVVKPSCRREMAHRALQQHGASIKAACQAFQISQACYRCSIEDDEIACASSVRASSWPMRARIHEVAGYTPSTSAFALPRTDRQLANICLRLWRADKALHHHCACRTPTSCLALLMEASVSLMLPHC